MLKEKYNGLNFSEGGSLKEKYFIKSIAKICLFYDN